MREPLMKLRVTTDNILIAKGLVHVFLGIKHNTSSPGYPLSNGFIERQVQTMKRTVEKEFSMGEGGPGRSKSTATRRWFALTS